MLNYTSTQSAVAMVDTTIAVNEGSTATVQAVTTPVNLALTWSSSNTSVATVDSTGKVTGIKAGTAAITATASDGASAICVVYVTIPNGVYRIWNMESPAFLDGGGANISPDNLTNVKLQNMISSGVDRLAQMWWVQYVGGGYYYIRPMHKLDYGLYLDGNDVKLSEIGTTSAVTQASANARWRIRNESDGYVLSHVSGGSVLAPVGNTAAAEKWLTTATYSASELSHHWRITAVPIPPSGILLYDAATGLPFDRGYVYVHTGQSKTLSDQGIEVSVYSAESISQSVTWSVPSNSAVNVSSSGMITGIRDGSNGITVSCTRGTTTLTASYDAYSYSNSVATYVFYDEGYARRYPDTMVRIRSKLNQLQEFYLSQFGIFIDYSSIENFRSLADECPTTDINSLCDCGTCEDSEAYPYPWEVDDPITEKFMHHKNFHNILLNMELPSADTVHFVFIGHLTCMEADSEYHDDLAGDTKGICYRNYRISSVFNFESDAAELRTMIHEFGHLFGAPDHYDAPAIGIPSSGALGSNFSQYCIYGENHTDPEVTDEIAICAGCRARIAEDADKYTP